MDFEAALQEKQSSAEFGESMAAVVNSAEAELDVERVKRDFNRHLETINSMLDQANEHNVNSRDSLEAAVGMASQAKTLGKELEAKRKEFVKVPNEYVKNVNAWVKKFVRPLNTIEATLKTKIAQYNHKLEMERQEREKKAREEAAKLQAEIDREAKEKGIEGAKVTPISVPKTDNVARTETGASAHTRKVWKAEIVETSQVPREFCTPDMKLINEAVKAGIREIAGVRIWEDTQTILRT